MSDSAARTPELVLVTGMSGAGRSTAARALEDMGWFVIDNLPPGKVLLAAFDRGVKNDAYKKAVDILRDQMRRHPRTSEGGFWHKQRYPHQMWLDGLYMASPFLAQYAVQFNEPALFDDVAKQIVLMDAHAYDAATGLYWHAWDEAKAQSWANPQTGVSPNFWSRAIGWYGMAIVDVLDYLPVNQPEIDGIVGALAVVSGWWLMSAYVGRSLAETVSGLFFSGWDNQGRPRRSRTSAVRIVDHTMAPSLRM